MRTRVETVGSSTSTTVSVPARQSLLRRDAPCPEVGQGGAEPDHVAVESARAELGADEVEHGVVDVLGTTGQGVDGVAGLEWFGHPQAAACAGTGDDRGPARPGAHIEHRDDLAAPQTGDGVHGGVDVGDQQDVTEADPGQRPAHGMVAVLAPAGGTGQDDDVGGSSLMGADLADESHDELGHHVGGRPGHPVDDQRHLVSDPAQGFPAVGPAAGRGPAWSRRRWGGWGSPAWRRPR